MSGNAGQQQHPKKVPTGPGGRKKKKEEEGETTSHPAAPGTQGGGGYAAGGKGGKGKGKDGKGKGKGKNDGSWSDGGNTDDGNAKGAKGQGKYKKTEEYPGKKIEDIPKDQRCCIHYCWVKKDGTSLCWKFNKGLECHAPHMVKPTKAMMESKVYNRLKDQYGAPNCPAGGPKAPKKDGE